MKHTKNNLLEHRDTPNTNTPTPTPKSKSKPKFHGFTLVELIVVITILAILGTIGFLSIGGYSSKARDSARIGDAAQIAKSLDLSIVPAGDYPTPDNAFAVTYSGGVLWNQGTIGSTVMQVFKSSISGGGLNEKPTDPLNNKEYSYSELADGKAYQLKVDYEGDLNQTAMDTSLVNSASAAPGDPTIAYIRGNFGGLAAKTTTGSTVFVIAIPSIMSNTGSAGVPIELRGTNALSGALLFNGQNLRGANSFNPNVVVFTGSKSTTNPLGLPSTRTEITNMMALLQSTYSGSSVRTTQSISSLIAMNTGALVNLWNTSVIADLGGKIGTQTIPETGLVTASCTSLPSNALYFNNTTSYSLASAASGTTLSAVTAGYFASPATNTCQWKCASGYTFKSGSCLVNTVSRTNMELTSVWMDGGAIGMLSARCPANYYVSSANAFWRMGSSWNWNWQTMVNLDIWNSSNSRLGQVGIYPYGNGTSRSIWWNSLGFSNGSYNSIATVSNSNVNASTLTFDVGSWAGNNWSNGVNVNVYGWSPTYTSYDSHASGITQWGGTTCQNWCWSNSDAIRLDLTCSIIP